MKIRLKIISSLTGEAPLNRCDGFYPLIAKLNYMTRYSDQARTRYSKTSLEQITSITNPAYNIQIFEFLQQFFKNV